MISRAKDRHSLIYFLSLILTPGSTRRLGGRGGRSGSLETIEGGVPSGSAAYRPQTSKPSSTASARGVAGRGKATVGLRPHLSVPRLTDGCTLPFHLLSIARWSSFAPVHGILCSIPLRALFPQERQRRGRHG
jgi:hypothetical protein